MTYEEDLELQNETLKEQLEELQEEMDLITKTIVINDKYISNLDILDIYTSGTVKAQFEYFNVEDKKQLYILFNKRFGTNIRIPPKQNLPVAGKKTPK
jgi:methionine salvage enolase-phosphatase E1